MFSERISPVFKPATWADVQPAPGVALPDSGLFGGVFDNIEATSVIKAELDNIGLTYLSTGPW
jgi:hypothetical protein